MTLWNTIKMKLGFDVSKGEFSLIPRLKAIFSEVIKTEPKETLERAKKKEFSVGQTVRTYNTNDNFFIKGSHKGGMGIVLFAERQQDNLYCALKTIREERLKSKEEREAFIKRFRWESQVWTILGKHRNIVQAYWFDRTSNYINYKPLLIMEYIERHPEYGNTLDECLRKTTLSIPTILDFSIQALTGLLYAQRVIKDELDMVFVHRDLKPSNIMIAKDGIVKVTDFGLVKAFEDIEGDLELKVEDGGVERVSVLKTGGICGTPPYMAPEQWLGEEPDERADIYAMGCIMYGMITGNKPFAPFAGPKFKEQHLCENPFPPKKGGAEIPEELSHLILKLLEKEKEKRIQTIYELREELHEIHKRLTGRRIEVKDEPEELTVWDLTNQGNGFKFLGFKDKAINCYRKALRINPEYEWALHGLGHAFADKGLLNEAIKEYREALRINPEFAETHNNLGIVLKDKGLLDEAISEFREALRINPEHIKARYNLGNVLKDKGLLDEAMKECREALRINPEDAEAHNNLGVVLYKKGLLDEAIKEYREALRINPEDTLAHNNLGVVLYKKGLLDEAIKEYREAIRVNPAYANAHYGLGISLHDKGLLDEAMKGYTEAMRLDPKHADAYKKRGDVYYEIGQHERAIADYDEAIRLDPSYSFAYNNRGIAYRVLGQYQSAISDYDEAIRTNPRFAKPYYNKALCLQKNLKRYEEALEIWKKYLELAKDDPQEKDWISKAKEHIKDLEKKLK